MDKPSFDWEAVYTVNEYYDGPRRGFANYLGRPHAYLSEWNDDEDASQGTFLLSPISEEQLKLAIEDWTIWRRFSSARESQGLTSDDRHPALAVDRQRYEELRPLIEQALVVDASKAVRAVPEFRGRLEPTHDLEVRWHPF